ncbi:hypothetical protein [Streptomyces sp. NPDC002845]
MREQVEARKQFRAAVTYDKRDHLWGVEATVGFVLRPTVVSRVPDPQRFIRRRRRLSGRPLTRQP